MKMCIRVQKCDPSQIQLGSLGERCKLPQRGLEPLDAHEFGAFQTKKEAFGAIYRYFLKTFEDRNFDTFHM